MKIRGTASHIAEKYSNLARDALSSGDFITAENYLQHAEHYQRIIQAAQPQQTAAGAQQGDANGSGAQREGANVAAKPQDAAADSEGERQTGTKTSETAASNGAGGGEETAGANGSGDTAEAKPASEEETPAA